MKDFVLGIDIGGSHITAALVDLETQTIVEGTSERLAVDSKASADRILTSWCEVINAAFSKAQSDNKRIGIAMPGPFDYEAGICLIQDQDKFKSLYRLNLKNELAGRLNIAAVNIRFVNDAAGFLQGEVFAGAAREGKQVIGLTLGTGLGSAFCENGAAVDAALWQSKFKAGIAEDYLSTRWFVARYFELTGQEITGVRELMGLENQSAVRKLIFEEFSNNLVEFLCPLIKKRNADIVVLGGNIAQAQLAFLTDVKRKFQENKVIAQVKIAELKEDAALIGAASCWEFHRH